MEDKQQKTLESITINNEEQEEQEEQLQFNNKQKTCHPFILYFLLFLILASIFFIFFKIATLNQNERINIVIPPLQHSFQVEKETNKSILYDSFISSDIILDQLADNYVEIKIDEQKQEDVIKAQKLNEFHVQYNKALRSIDYSNAKIQFSQLLEQQIFKDSPIKYSQFLQALGLLQLTTLPYMDYTEQSKILSSQELEYYHQKWKISQKQPPICVILMLTTQGLNSGSYYYSIRSLFQQNYSNYKVVIIENKPSLGIEANIRGLIKQVSQEKAVIIDRINGQESQGSSVFYSLHRYCRQSEYSIILRDNGQIIGKQAFSVINSAHQTKKTPIVFSHYLLDSQNVFANLQKDFRYRVQLYPSYKNASNPKEQLYKTKYIQSYQTQLLLSLPLSVFKTLRGEWYSHSFQSALQFAALEKSCGNYYILPQILFRLPKSVLQTNLIIKDARSHNKLMCFSNDQILVNGETNIPFSLEYKKFSNNLIQLNKIGNLTNEEEVKIDRKLLIFNIKRQLALSKQIQRKQSKLALQSQNPITQENNISLTDQIQVLKNMMDSRVHIYENFQTVPIEYQQEYYLKKQIKSKEKTLKDYNETKNSQKLIQDFRHQQSTFFCILLLTQNNQENFGYFYSMQSVLKQKYSNYRLIILDNGSSDNTAKSLKRHLSKLDAGPKKKVRIFSSSESHPEGEYLFFGARKFCSSKQVMIVMKGGQQLIGNQVLKKLNKVYRETNALAIHTGNIFHEDSIFLFNSLATYQKNIIETKDFRQHQLLFNSLRAFRVSLFVNIAEIEFKRRESWSNYELQFNISYAILEMACSGLKHIKQVLYRINMPSKDFPSLQKQQIDPSLYFNGKLINQTVKKSYQQPKYQCFQEHYLQINP